MRFRKMHGLGNDFVIVDLRGGRRAPDSALVRAVADRRRGIGFDQFISIEDDPSGEIAAYMGIWNPDGSRSGACGNATRCIADWEMARRGAVTLELVTERGALRAVRRDGVVAVDMGAPILDWAAIPLARDVCTLHLPVEGDPAATGMGNPHCTFFVDDADAADLAAYGAFETHDLFPERTNVQVASLIAPNRLRMRVWERGVGPTLASGSSSCAAAVAAARRGITGRTVEVVLDGGTLAIDWREDGVWMAGPTAHVFDGVWHG